MSEGPSEDGQAVHLAQRVGDQLHPGAVGVAEVHRGAALEQVLDAGLVQAGAQLRPALGLDGDREMVQPAEDLGVRPDVEAGEVEERDEVAVADVEEEVVGARIVTVLNDLGQGEPEHPLIEVHRPLDVRAHDGDVMQAAGRRGGPRRDRGEVRRPDPLALGGDGGEVELGHGSEATSGQGGALGAH